jgi:diaminopimelate decarboxylase
MTTTKSRFSSSSLLWRLGVNDPGASPVPRLPSETRVGPSTTGADIDAVPLRLLPETAGISANGRLTVGGVDLVDLSNEVGTPAFVYDEQHLRNRCREAKESFGDGVAYASKAFLCRAMAALVAQEGMMIDVSSGGELYVAISAGVAPDRLVLHGSNKSLRELAMAMALGVGRIVVDSFDEIDRLEQLAQHFPARNMQALLIRVNPGIEPSTHAAVATGQEDSKFGFSVTTGAAARAIERLRRLNGPLHLKGLHVHIGSQILDLSAMERSVEVLAPLLLEAALGEMCVGGGLGVASTASDERAPSLADWAQTVRRACRRFGLPSSVRITAEPGRSIAAAAAITLYTIGTMKPVSKGRTASADPSIDTVRTYVGVDGGMSDNPRPALYGSRYEAFLPRAASAQRPLVAKVVGKHCESGDVLVPNAQLPEDTVVGDVLAVPVTGAYCYSMASSYNKLLRPPVIFVHDGGFRIVTRRETYRDLLRLDV